MIELTGLNGERVLIAPATICRIRPGDLFGPPLSTEVEYAGGYLFTDEDVSALIKRLEKSLKLVALTTRSGLKVYLNAAAITRVRRALAINGTGTELVVGGHYQHVVEDLAEVEALIGV